MESQSPSQSDATDNGEVDDQFRALLEGLRSTSEYEHRSAVSGAIPGAT